MADGFTWETASPEAHGLDAAKLDAMRTGLAERGTRALLIVRNDCIVYEWYGPNHGPEKRHHTASLAKALVGGTSLMLALADGLMAADDPAWKYVPEWKDDSMKSQITIRHLATHASGVEDAELSEADQEAARAEGRTASADHMELPGWKGGFWRQEPDPFTLSRDAAPVMFAPGTQYAYSNPGMAMLATCVTASLQGTPHRDIRTLLRERVMRPIGIGDGDWSVGYEKTF